MVVIKEKALAVVGETTSYPAIPQSHSTLGDLTLETGWGEWANTYNKFDPMSPFGGYKESGFSREGGLQELAADCRVS